MLMRVFSVCMFHVPMLKIKLDKVEDLWFLCFLDNQDES